MTSSASIINSMFSENEWIEHIQQNLKQDLENVIQIPFSIFQVLESAKASKPDAYTPQLIALGPYHHFRSHLYHMETFKLAVAKRAVENFQLSSINELVEKLKACLPTICASYSSYLVDVHKTAMPCIMVIDGLFLLELIRNNGVFPSMPQKNFSKDAVMLENQIPILALGQMLENCRINDQLSSSFVHFCIQLSPLPVLETCPAVAIRHLLDLLYKMICLKDEPLPPYEAYSRMSIDEMATVAWDQLKNDGSGIFAPIISSVDRIITVSKRLGISTYLRKVFEEDEAFSPTATQLRRVGVEFCITRGGIRNISFDQDDKSFKFNLPVFTWKPNCEVVMRNLLAYEAMAKSEPPILTRYTQLMSGIVRTVEDVKLLKDKKIIVTVDEQHVDYDDIVQLFSGIMGKSTINLEEKTILDDHIEAVNKYYDNNPKIKASKLFKKYVKFSWKLFMLLAAILLFTLLGIQTFCDIYNCHSLFGTTYPVNGLSSSRSSF
ncbi:hypothetical protein JCGZ_06999 [Jatropha curcas]|uniref:Uncharacterized protein n=2 Tax=Jatropha curcas TaxID=180498 RepID=A0A067KEJ5_JATCU|nr:hypothetical protein JCGZ_06999 [Jatropha curcas]